MEIILPRNEIPIRSTRLSLADVIKIYQRLSAAVNEQAQIELSKLQRSENQTEEDFQHWKTNAEKHAFRVTVTIFGRDGTSLFGDDPKVFESPLLPTKIQSIFATNVTAYRSFTNAAPLNFFELNLDFSKPPLIDTNNFVSSPTPNNSNLVVQGDRDGWVAAVGEAVLVVTRGGKTNRSWLHRGLVYDAGLFGVGVPAALYACWALSDFINNHLQSIHPIVGAAAYIYIVLLSLNAYRALFGYAKWTFPTMELTNNNDSAIAHRAALLSTVAGVVGKLVYDLLF
jgi:hypothetical protein